MYFINHILNFFRYFRLLFRFYIVNYCGYFLRSSSFTFNFFRHN
nr:MAG TPA: hypothetical protein [Bacteriophage sp.]